MCYMGIYMPISNVQYQYQSDTSLFLYNVIILIEFWQKHSTYTAIMLSS